MPPAGGDIILARHVDTRVATAALTADSAAYTTEVAPLTVTAYLEAGQTYAIEARNVRVSISAGTFPAAENAQLRIREDTVTGNQLVLTQIPILIASGNGYAVPGLYVEFTAVTTGSKTFCLTAQRVGGSANHQIRAAANSPALLTVDLIP